MSAATVVPVAIEASHVAEPHMATALVAVALVGHLRALARALAFHLIGAQALHLDSIDIYISSILF